MKAPIWNIHHWLFGPHDNSQNKSVDRSLIKVLRRNIVFTLRPPHFFELLPFSYPGSWEDTRRAPFTLIIVDIWKLGTVDVCAYLDDVQRRCKTSARLSMLRKSEWSLSRTLIFIRKATHLGLSHFKQVHYHCCLCYNLYVVDAFPVGAIRLGPSRIFNLRPGFAHSQKGLFHQMDDLRHTIGPSNKYETQAIIIVIDWRKEDFLCTHGPLLPRETTTPGGDWKSLHLENVSIFVVCSSFPFILSKLCSDRSWQKVLAYPVDTTPPLRPHHSWTILWRQRKRDRFNYPLNTR